MVNNLIKNVGFPQTEGLDNQYKQYLIEDTFSNFELQTVTDVTIMVTSLIAVPHRFLSP